MNNGKGFSKLGEPTEQDGDYHLKFGFLLLFSVDERLELGNRANGKAIPTFRSERKKRTTPVGSLQFLNGFSGKLLFHLTFNRNFQIFWLNGKHPNMFAVMSEKPSGI